MDVAGPGSLGEGLNRAVVNPNVLMSNIFDGNTSIQRCFPQELYPLPVRLGEGHSILWMENSHWILVWHFDPGHHAEITIPGAQTVKNHPFLQTHYHSFLLGSNWTKRFPVNLSASGHLENITCTKLNNKSLFPNS